MSKKKRTAKNTAVIYARFSSDNQREESITGQLRECHAFAAREGLTVIHEYIDRALSARTDRRPDFLRMIEDSRLGMFSYVIVYQLDRFSRDRYDSAIYKRALKLSGVRVLSARENISADPSGILVESFLEGNAEYFSADLSLKVTRGMTENVLEGKWPGSYFPFGFMLDTDHHLVWNPLTHPALEHIIAMFLQGHTEREIRDWLDAHHFTQTNGRPFRRTFLAKLLRNTLLKGVLTWGEVESPNFVAPTLTEAEFDKIQWYLDSRKKNKGVKRINLNYHLTGKLYCSCGMAMTGMCGTSQGGYRFYYYMCASKSNKIDGLHQPCGAKNIRCDILEKLIVDNTVKMLSDPETVHFIAVNATEQMKKNVDTTTLKRLKTAISEVQKKLDNYIKAVERGIFSDTIAENITACEAKLKKLRFDFDREKEMHKVSDITEEEVEFYLTQWLPKQKSGECQLSLFSTFIHRIILFADCVEVQYNYPTQSAEHLVNPRKIDCSQGSLLVTQ